VNPTVLAGVTVLVTRPPGQADGLCERIQAEGGTALRWPAVEIAATAPDEPVERALDPGMPPDWLIFISRNAVQHGTTALAMRPRPRIAAIGPATAAALAQVGVTPALTARKPDSEGLLDDPAFAAVEGQRVVIVRGVGGREALALGLRARGARVGYEEVYRRRRPQPSAEAVAGLLKRWQTDGIQVYTATSVEILRNLHDMLGPAGSEPLARTALVTASERVVKQADSFGHEGACLLASRPDDAALVEAIAEWRSGRCTAP
jgi:uroporphyrinogen-III synthase